MSKSTPYFILPAFIAFLVWTCRLSLAWFPSAGPPADGDGMQGESKSIVKLQREAVRVSADVQEPKLIYKVDPVYPPLAKAAHVQGEVILDVTVTENGEVAEVKVLRGHPLFDKAALDAVKRWRYSPTYSNGEPVPVITTVTLVFALKEDGPSVQTPSAAEAANSAESYFAQGNVLQDGGKNQEAMDAYTKAIERNPRHSEAYRKRAVSKLRLQQYKEAIPDFDISIQLNPSNSSAYVGRGTARRRGLSDRQGALSDYTRAIDLDPRHLSAYYSRGELRSEMNDFEGAERDCRQSISLNATYTDGYLCLGFISFRQKNYVHAIGHFSKAIELAPRSHFGYLNRAVAYQEKGDPRAASADLEKVRELNPGPDVERRIAELKSMYPGLARGVEQAPPAQIAAAPQPGTGAPATPQSRPKPAPQAPARAGTGGTAAGSAAPPPAPVTAVQLPQRQTAPLPPFAGFRTGALAEQAKASDPRIPWGPGGGASTPISPEKISEHHGALRHAMTRMQSIHGTMTPQQKKDFSAVWAPLFDYPTSESHAYLKQLNPALDEYVAAAAQAEAVAPVYRDNLAQLALTAAAGDDRATAMALDSAAAHVGLLKESQQRMDKALAQIKRFGNPPNPLAAKAAAQEKTRTILSRPMQQPSESLEAQFTLPQYWVASVSTEGHTASRLRPYPSSSSGGAAVFAASRYQSHKGPQAYGTGINAAAIAMVFSEAEFTKLDPKRGKQEFEWFLEGNYRDGPAGFIYDYRDDPDRHRQSVLNTQETIDGVRFTLLFRPFEPFSSSIADCDPRNKDAPCISGTYRAWGRAYGNLGQQFVILAFEFECFIDTLESRLSVESERSRCKGQYDEWLRVVRSMRLVPKGSSIASGTAASEPRQDLAGAGLNENVAANSEAMAQHQVLAQQREDSARTWEAQADGEKDPKRRQELLDNAEYDRDMAQAERDLAESLKSGTIVHTRTQWEDRQQQKLVENIKTELAEFDKDKQRIELLPKLGKLVEGADGVRLREELQKQLQQALKAPDRGAQLDKMIERLKRVIVTQRDAEAAKKEDRLAQTEYYLQTAEGIKQGADAAMWASSFLVPGAGAVSIAYGVGTGYADGGITQAAENFARAQSNYIDIAAAALYGGLEIDPNTGQRRGITGAATAGLHTAVLNHMMGWATSKSTNFIQGAINKARLPARPEAFKDNHERCREATAQARTPEQRQAVEKNYRVIRDREMLKGELKQVTERHEAMARKVAGQPDGTIDTRNPEYQRIQSQWQSDMAAARAKYAPRETRMSDHAKVLAAAKLNADDIPLSGGEPKHIMSDLDVAPKTLTAGQAYVNAVKSGGREVLEFHDRWIVPDSDMTIWKPGSGADKPGSRSFEESVIEASLFGSDKFPTTGGVEYTTQGGVTYDPRGAVMANAKKAVEAGIGGRESDLHVIGKSLDKSVEIAGSKADPALMGKAQAVRGHATAEEAGIVTFGASEKAKAQERSRFLAQSRETLADAYQAASETSNKFTAALNKQLAAAKVRGDAATVREINQTLNAYKLSNDLTVSTLSVLDPATMGQIVSREPTPSPPSMQGFGWLTEQLTRDRTADERARPPIAPAPALPGLSQRMKQAAVQIAERVKGVPAGSQEAQYLSTLQKALERGVANPAQAVTEIRLISGQELATVLSQLGVGAGSR